MSAIITDGPKVLADNRLVNIRGNFKLAKDPTSELLSEIIKRLTIVACRHEGD